jgi:hypothetical protein
MAKKRKLKGRPGSRLPALVDPRFAKALSHILRQHILLAMVYGEFSPKELATKLNEEVNQVSYHVRVLREIKIIRGTRTERRRGAIEHYYRANIKALLPIEAWQGLEQELRAIVGAAQANDVFNELAEAVEAGKLDGEHDLLSRTPLVLDVEGKRNVKAIMERAYREVEGEQGEAANRMVKANGNGHKATGYSVALLAFETAWDPESLQSRKTKK